MTDAAGIRNAVVAFCESCFAEHGDSPQGVGWPRGDADVRYRVMLDVLREANEPASVLDVGCGTSGLYQHIVDRGLDGLSYSGLDASPTFLEASRRKFPDVTYYGVDLLAADAPPLPEFDYVIANGLFTYKGAATFDDMFAYLKQVVARVFPLARKGVAFNVTSRQVDWERDDLFHLPVDTLMDFLSQEVSRHVVVRHDYGLYEYTVYVYREPNPPAATRRIVHRRPAPEARPPADPAAVFGSVSLDAADVRQLQRDLDSSRSRHDVPVSLLAELEAHRKTDAYRALHTTPDPLVSVCVCTYNRRELLIGRCLASILEQDYPNLEVIVVGDGCTDDTETAIMLLGDRRVRFENGPRERYPEQAFARWMVAGTSATNRAMELARGSFVTHLDDDDEYLPGRIRKLVDFMQAERAEVAWHPFLNGTADGGWTIWPAPEFASGHLTTGSVMYMDWLKRIPFDPESYRYLEAGDWNRCRKLAHLGARLARHPEPLLRHYVERTQMGRGSSS